MKIAVVSGSRADHGGLTAVLDQLSESHDAYELTESDVHKLTESGAIKWGADLAVVLGDRYEILRAVVELYIAGIPIAHLSGGDITEGSADDCMRHAITKLSHLHFVTNEKAARRVIQMGEEPWRVHNVGYPGEDNAQVIDFDVAIRRAFIPSYEIGKYIIVVWHPNTLSTEENMLEVIELINSLDRIFEKTIVIGPNLDQGHLLIRSQFKNWCNRTHNMYHDNLPRNVYLTLLKYCACLVGNSSSGFYEAPIFGTPVVNIGDRQKGREPPANMICVDCKVPNIVIAVKDQIKVEKSYPTKPNGAAKKIAEAISKIEDPKALLRKRWCDVSGH